MTCACGHKNKGPSFYAWWDKEKEEPYCSRICRLNAECDQSLGRAGALDLEDVVDALLGILHENNDLRRSLNEGLYV
jgi:hypothetical protein